MRSFVISFIVASVLMNNIYHLYMKLIGASAMRFNAGKKFLIILFVALFITATIIQIFGIEIP